jgi:hypothetical protein
MACERLEIITRGRERSNKDNNHDYLGMDLDLSNAGEVKIAMINYLKEVLEDFPEICVGSSRTPATKNLFIFRLDTKNKLLEESRAIAFHH